MYFREGIRIQDKSSIIILHTIAPLHLTSLLYTFNVDWFCMKNER